MTIKWNCLDGERCYVRHQLPDWAMLDGCVGQTRVSASDIDGIIHQNGHLLFLEKKHPTGVLSPPQIRVINCLVRHGDAVIAFWCTKPNGEDVTKMRVWGIRGYDSTRLVDASLADLRKAVTTWWGMVYAEGVV
jgi:hypothetical protein